MVADIAHGRSGTALQEFIIKVVIEISDRLAVGIFLKLLLNHLYQPCNLITARYDERVRQQTAVFLLQDIPGNIDDKQTAVEMTPVHHIRRDKTQLF